MLTPFAFVFAGLSSRARAQIRMLSVWYPWIVLEACFFAGRALAPGLFQPEIELHDRIGLEIFAAKSTTTVVGAHVGKIHMGDTLYRKGAIAEALRAFKKIYLEVVDQVVDHLQGSESNDSPCPRR